MNLPSRFPKNRPTRRELLKLLAAGVGGASLSGWLGPLAAAAQQQAKSARPKSCILLWMDGGPSHVDTFDPKPAAGAEIHGDIGALGTSVPGIQIGGKFPRLAKLMHHGAIIRSMSTAEADHGRARVHAHGLPARRGRHHVSGARLHGVGGTRPARLAAAEFRRHRRTAEQARRHPRSRLPRPAASAARAHRLEPRPGKCDACDHPGGIRPPDATARKARTEFRAKHPGSRRARAPRRADRRAATHALRSPRLLRPFPRARGFAQPLRYGDTDFGRGCLLARRLVEAGVGFAEVYLANWDSHTRPVAEKTRELMTQVDLGMSALVSDLHSRGLLESTLIIWMGEFGRTPRINSTGGRDHYSKAWSTVLFGGGIRAGQVIGSTDATGAEVKDRPVSVMDFMATTCHLLGIDYKKEIDTPAGRPIRIVDKGERLIQELLA